MFPPLSCQCFPSFENRWFLIKPGRNQYIFTEAVERQCIFHEISSAWNNVILFPLLETSAWLRAHGRDGKRAWSTLPHGSLPQNMSACHYPMRRSWPWAGCHAMGRDGTHAPALDCALPGNSPQTPELGTSLSSSLGKSASIWNQCWRSISG